MMNQFKETKNLYARSINYSRPLSYAEWLETPDNHKVAVLFVQFFDQISLAWYKLRTNAAIEEECVSEVMSYLLKNVYGISLQKLKGQQLPAFDPAKSKIQEKSFNPKYIYRVAYNCIYCKSIDPYKGQTAANSWYNNTTPQYVQYGDDELDILDTVVVNKDVVEEIERNRFWSLIEDQDKSTKDVVELLLAGKKVPEKSAHIVEKLKDLLKEFAVDL